MSAFEIVIYGRLPGQQPETARTAIMDYVDDTIALTAGRSLFDIEEAYEQSDLFIDEEVDALADWISDLWTFDWDEDLREFEANDVWAV